MNNISHKLRTYNQYKFQLNANTETMAITQRI